MAKNTAELTELREKARKLVEGSPSCGRDARRKQAFFELAGKVDDVKALSEFVGILEREQADWKQMAEKAMERLKGIEKKYKTRIHTLKRKAKRDIAGFQEQGEHGQTEAMAGRLLEDL